MTSFRDRVVDNWNAFFWLAAPIGLLILVYEWVRQRRRLREQLELAESGWEKPDA